MTKEDIFLNSGFSLLIASLVLAKIEAHNALVMSIFFLGCISLCSSFFIKD